MTPPLRMRLRDSIHTIGRVLFRRVPLTAPVGRLRCDPLFIIGSGRSGNTLLRAMLIAQGDISIPPESYVLPEVIRKFCRFGFLPWVELSRLMISEFERDSDFYTWGLELGELYERAAKMEEQDQSLAALLELLYLYYAEKKYPRATRWGDKTPLNTLSIERLHWVFPSAHYIHLIRDGRDVVASYLETGIYKDLGMAADRWLRSYRRAQGFGKRLGTLQYLELRYEELVQDAESSLQRVCSFLGLAYRVEMLEFWKYSHQLGDAVLPHHANIANPLNAHSIGRWQRTLDRADQVRLANLIGRDLSVLGYA